MLSTRNRLLAVSGGIFASVVLFAAGASAAAGPPQSFALLLCGTTAGFAASPHSGNSDIDHPTGLQASGTEYTYSGQNCQNPGSSGGNFSWTVGHANVNTSTEHGTEHADASMTMLAETGSFANGFNGGVFEYDFGGGDSAPCGNRSVFYASGHAFDATCSIGSAPGNFNTEGGASSGQHYNGKYGTLIYQEDQTQVPTTQCPTGSSTYCFQAVIQGQFN